MRRREEWMNKASEPILELLADTGLALPPKAIEVNLERLQNDPPSRSSIFNAFEPLVEHGYIENIADSGSYYVITDTGRAYLQGELDDK